MNYKKNIKIRSASSIPFAK